MSLTFNPQALPSEPIKRPRAVPSEFLTAEALRIRFKKDVPWMPEKTDEHQLSTSTFIRPAAVLIPLIIKDNGLHLLLTQRAAHLHDHPGQISFPGGRYEEADRNSVETALRETFEEIGIHRAHIDVIGSLPQYRTATGYDVTPVVSLVKPGFEVKIDSFEVASIFEVPLAFLMNEANHQLRKIELPNNAGKRTFYAMPYEDHFIWGATAGMLRNLFHFLSAAEHIR